MDFDLDKKNHLNKKDKSKKGSIDAHIKDVVDKINELDNYFTTSSCSGRIRVISMDINSKKNEVEWLFTSHETIDRNKEIVIESDKEEQWFIMEGAILHLCSRTLEDAHKIIKIAQESGFKRSGIINADRRIIIELLNNDRIETIIGKRGELIVTKEYLAELVEIANRKLLRNFNKIDRFHKRLKELEN